MLLRPRRQLRSPQSSGLRGYRIRPSLSAPHPHPGRSRRPKKGLCAQSRPPISGPSTIFFLKSIFLMHPLPVGWGPATGPKSTPPPPGGSPNKGLHWIVPSPPICHPARHLLVVS